MKRSSDRRLQIGCCLVASSVLAGACAPRRIGVPAPPRPEYPSPAVIWMPESSRLDLPNGLAVIAVHDPRAPIFEARLVVRSGWSAEDAGHPGASLLVRELVRNAYARLRDREAAPALDTEGVSFIAGTRSDVGGSTTTFRLTGPSPGLIPAVGILGSALRSPDFGASEVESQRAALIDGRRAQAGDVAAFAANRAILLLRAPEQRGRAEPSEADLRQLRVEDARAFHAAHYVPRNSVLVIMGPQSIEELQEITSGAFGPWVDAGTGPSAAAGPSGTTLRAGGGCEFLERPGSAQVSLVLGAVAAGQANADYAGLLLLRWLLMMRLQVELAERGWAYNVGVDYNPGSASGEVVIATSVQPGRGRESLSVIRAELERLVANPPDSAEVASAVRMVAGELASFPAERREVLASRIVDAEIGGLGGDFWRRVRERLMAFNGRELQDLARRYFRSDAFSVVGVGDPTELGGFACPAGAR